MRLLLEMFLVISLSSGDCWQSVIRDPWCTKNSLTPCCLGLGGWQPGSQNNLHWQMSVGCPVLYPTARKPLNCPPLRPNGPNPLLSVVWGHLLVSRLGAPMPGVRRLHSSVVSVPASGHGTAATVLIGGFPHISSWTTFLISIILGQPSGLTLEISGVQEGPRMGGL